MIVKRIIANLATSDVSKARRFYGDIIGLEVAMDLGWIVTFASTAQMAAQLSVATEGGSGTPVPDISIEVDDLDEVERRVREAGLAIEYGPTVEPWGVRRFYVRDPLGKLVNILSHE
jgi:catechol 2,3-dioxygenase-like lactoylglutathione lyase family enzyme